MSLRELLLILIVTASCLTALVKPRIGLYAWVWYGAMRPDSLAWVTHLYPFSGALAASTLLGSLRFWSAAGVVLKNPICRWLLLFQIPVAVSVALAAAPLLSFNPSDPADRYTEFLRVTAVVLLIPVLVQSERDLRCLLLVIGVSLGAWGTKIGLYGLRHGVMVTAPADWGMDNNTLSVALAMAMPFCWFLRPPLAVWARVALLGTTGLSIAAVLLSNSRGASVALAALFLTTLARSKRKLLTLASLAVCSGLAIYEVRDDYIARLSTLQAYDQEASAASRIDHAKAAFAMWLEHPVFGVGFGGKNYANLASRYLGRENIHVVHDSYLQVLVDSGIFAFLIYTGLLVGTIMWLERSARRARRARPGTEVVPIAIQASLMVFAVGSTFYSLERFELLYVVLMCAASWYTVEQTQLVGVAAPAEPSRRGPDRRSLEHAGA